MSIGMRRRAGRGRSRRYGSSLIIRRLLMGFALGYSVIMAFWARCIGGFFRLSKDDEVYVID